MEQNETENGTAKKLEKAMADRLEAFRRGEISAAALTEDRRALQLAEKALRSMRALRKSVEKDSA